jgi:hypothetical protein
MTIIHQSVIACEMVVIRTLAWLSEKKKYTHTRLVVNYKSPLPLGDDCHSPEKERILLEHVPREPEISNQASLHSGIFRRPLEEAAFERHLKGLEYH